MSVQAQTTDVRPPPEHESKPWHWIYDPDEPDPDLVKWTGNGWQFWGVQTVVFPNALILEGCRYLGPAELPK